MKDLSFLRRLLFTSLLVFLSAFSAWAHAVVHPQRVDPNSFEKFVLRVPTEKQIPTTSVRLLIPENIQVFAIAAEPGWAYETEKDSAGRPKSVTWSGGELPPGEFVEFEFMGRTAKEPGRAVWKAFQTYKDGSVVSWTGPPEAKEPASITLIESAVNLGAPAWVSWSALGLSIIAALAAVLVVLKRG